MPIMQATHAFLWRLNTANFKATYGRYPENSGDTSYTKNYLQVPGKVRDELNAVLGYDATAGHAVNVKWRWPDGSFENRYDNKNSNGDTRGQLYITQGTHNNDPSKPKTVVITPFVPGPAGSPSTAIDGDPNLPSPADATSLLEAILNSAISAWYLAVALKDEVGVLHARMILEKPPPGKEQFGLDRQPLAIKRAIEAARREDSCISTRFEFKSNARSVVQQIMETFERSPNVLLVGPPGCGKSVALDDVKKIYTDTAWFDTESYDCWVRDVRKAYETAFHPAFSYENFVAGLAPKPGHGIDLEVRSGPLMNMAQWCRNSTREALLLIDEFNRGPAASIFGDTLVLLDKGKRSASDCAGVSISRPHPDREIDVPGEFASQDPDIGSRVPKNFTLPSGLKILGAFNSSDRSVAPLDAALLRRFSLVRVGPDPEALAEHLGLHPFDRTDVTFQKKPIADWDAADVRRLAVQLLIRLNDRLRLILGDDHLLGHALFWEVPADADREKTAAVLAAEFEEKVIGRLRQTLRDRDEQIAIILGVSEPGGIDNGGVATWIESDTRIGRLVGAKLDIRNLKIEPFEKQVAHLLIVLADET